MAVKAQMNPPASVKAKPKKPINEQIVAKVQRALKTIDSVGSIPSKAGLTVSQKDAIMKALSDAVKKAEAKLTGQLSFQLPTA